MNPENNLIRSTVRSFFLFLFCAAVFLAGSAPSLFADTSLSEEQKAAQRNELNQAARMSALLAARAKPQAAAPNPWTLNVVSTAGYDRNVTFDSRRLGDTFHEEAVTSSYTADHGKLLSLLPSGKYGFTANLDQQDYARRNESDYRNYKLNPFLSVNLTPTASLKTEYTFRDIRYLKNDQISYLSHETKTSLSESRWAHWLHTLYASVEYKNYTVHRASTEIDTASSDLRQDILHEYGYSVMFFPSNQFVVGGTGAFKINDSNDNFESESNDFGGYKISAFVYAALNDKLSGVAATGYDCRKYKVKRLDVDPAKKESDGLLYFAAYLYYNLTPKTQLVMSYLWDENFSNDPAEQFTDHIITAGFSVKL